MKGIIALVALVLAAGSVGCGSPLSTGEETQTAVGGGTPSSLATRAVSETPTGGATVTPQPTTNADEMEVYGYAWIDAERANVTVRAFIGETECASSNAGNLVDGYESWYALHLPSAEKLAGCGAPGASVRFTLGDRSANQTVAWTPGEVGPIDLIAGPDFERIYGEYTGAEGGFSGRVEATVDGRPCSLDMIYEGSELVGDDPVFELVVFPEELRPGCGRAGARIAFEFVSYYDGVRGAVVATSRDNYPWEPGAVRNVDLTFVAVPGAQTAPLSPPGAP